MVVYNGYNIMGNYLVIMLDSPSTSSATLTYKVQGQVEQSGSQCYWGYGDGNTGGSSASIVLMEIAQ